MPKTLPWVARAASLLMVRPPPQPTSRMVQWGAMETCERPQSVSLEWDLFMRQSVMRPSQPRGFWHCETGVGLAAMVRFLCEIDYQVLLRNPTFPSNNLRFGDARELRLCRDSVFDCGV